MPNINFTLPHWLYWLGLVLFPLLAMWLSRRHRDPNKQSYKLTTAYFIWLVGGFLGLHRLYLRNYWGLLLWPLFFFILYASAMEREARVSLSDARAELEVVNRSIERNSKRIDKSELDLAKYEEQMRQLSSADASQRQRLQRRIDRERERISSAGSSIQSGKQAISTLQANLQQATQSRDAWLMRARYVFYFVLAWLLFDLWAIPRLKQRAAGKQADTGSEFIAADASAEAEADDDRKHLSTGIAGIIDRVSLHCGEFVALWSVIAVFIYYYEVVARYVFNSPTNWAHESMFLMFGMQYLVAGSYAMLTGSHVRVDIFYARLSRRGKAIVDLLTSVFFFIFAGTLLVTGWIFAADAMQGDNWQRWEVSFTEWAIQYWPVKIAIVVGAGLLVLQGISQVLQNLAIVFADNKQESGA